MSGIEVRKFTIPSEMLDAVHGGKVPSASDLAKAVSDYEGDSDG